MNETIAVDAGSSSRRARRRISSLAIQRWERQQTSAFEKARIVNSRTTIRLRLTDAAHGDSTPTPSTPTTASRVAKIQRDGGDSDRCCVVFDDVVFGQVGGW